MEDRFTDLRRLMWLLYADTNTRFNLMIDECAHLQQTINSHLAHTDPATSDTPPARNVGGGEERAWIPEDNKIRDDDYYFRGPQERALRNLRMSMGGLAAALEANQKELRACFKKSFYDYRPQNNTQTDSLFWFISLRGHYLNTVFPRHLSLLQHAHEKLIQLLENMPGILPGPTLMRRWSSGGYGEFLSEYSRQVNWEVQDLFWQFCVGSDVGKFEEWRAKRFLVHTWSHRATSNTLVSRLETLGTEHKTLSFITIWSSYFYLELPILFPLLYHECAHHNLDKPSEPIESQDEKASERAQLWFNRPNETAELLQRVEPFEGDSHAFWKSFTSEIWADVISIASCGDGYLAALALQVVGLEGDYKAYSDYDVEADAGIPLNQIGQTARRVRSAQYPILELPYFWEARIQIVLNAYEQIYPNRTNPWVQALKSLLAHWDASGQVAMSPAAASTEHSSYWQYRGKLNRWVAQVVTGALEDFLIYLKAFRRKDQFQKAYGLDNRIVSLMSTGLVNYAESIFSPPRRDFSPFEPKRIQWRLEDVCAHVRWTLSGPIDAELLGGDYEKLSHKWMVVYANYMRAGDGVVFRLALEWISTLKDVVHSAAWLLRDQESETGDKSFEELAKHEKEFLREIRDAVWSDFRNRRGLNREAAARELAMRVFAEHANRWPKLQGLLDRFGERLLARLGEVVRSGVKVGTYTLGVARPSFVAKTGSYAAALNAIKHHYEEGGTQRHKVISNEGFAFNPEQGSFSPLFGEYSFASYQHGMTPVERDIHPISPPPSVLKSRAVLQLSKRKNPSKCALSFVKVSQIGFRYRWQWVLLAELWQDTADIFLSSAWEDVILVTYHETLQDYNWAIRERGLGLRRWQDIHSSIGLAEMNSIVGARPQLSEKEFSSSMVKAINTLTPHVAYYRTGRYDAYIEWRLNSPRSLLQVLDGLPPVFWHQLESMVTSLLCLPACDQAGLPTYSLVSQLILRHEKFY